jgi:hypothetical protein
MQRDRRFRVAGRWALASDGVQWILQHGREGVSFVHTSKDILARCMRDKGVPPDIAADLLQGLPADFQGWYERFDPSGYLDASGPDKPSRRALELEGPDTL